MIMPKTVTKEITETTRETYDTEDFSEIVKITVTTTKIDEFGKESRHSSRKVSHKTSYRELNNSLYVKQLVLLRAKYSPVMELPYSIANSFLGSDLPEEKWYHALTSDNPPGKTIFNFKGKHEEYLKFKEIVDAIDFRIYDDNKANEIRAMYQSDKKKATMEIDASLIEAENFGEAE